MRDITDVDYKYTKRVWKYSEIKSLGKYHNLYVWSYTVLLANEFEKLRNIFLGIYKFDLACLFTAPGLAWQAALKKIELKLELLTHINISLVVEKSVRGEICHAIHQYLKSNNKYIKDYDEKKIIIS